MQDVRRLSGGRPGLGVRAVPVILGLVAATLAHAGPNDGGVLVVHAATVADTTDTESDREYRSEMAAPDASRVIDLLAALSRRADFSIGCHCDDEVRCYRSVLARLLTGRSADLVRS